ncbi:type IV toxin-antitoxin system AbiEi family antitoxin domain-containing protein [Williamsia sp. MIQD14]|uniref:type IV toxin-antitoxin system AbiEi family antitoxin domain-containing protein n=1 Tax=Williamsia sp. MIQD14 TaxID=3425703 RepID=UPI003DA0DA1F
MITLPSDRHGLVHRETALAAGFTDDEIRRELRDGRLSRVQRGVYVAPATRSPEAAHRLAAIASAETSPARAILSHQSAAAMHGLSMLRPDLQRVHTTNGNLTGGWRTSVRQDHVGLLADHELTTVDGVLVTSLERTAVDVARTTRGGFAAALAVFDSALRLGADREEMTGALDASRRGVGPARRALSLADGAAENPGESWSRALMIEAGLPAARLQHTFVDGHGNDVARTDFDWSGRLVGEFDGDVKYQRYLRPGETPFDAMKREKLREDALRRLGIMVIRWTWTDLVSGRLVTMVREWLVRLDLMAA